MIAEPDVLLITFALPELFIDEETRKALSQEPIVFKLPLSKQYTREEYARLKDEAKKAAQVGIALTLLELAIVFLFKKVLFSMWILILTLQFFVYMATW